MPVGNNSIFGAFTLGELDVLVAEIDLNGTIVFAEGKLIKKLGLNLEDILKHNIFDNIVICGDLNIDSINKNTYKKSLLN